MSPIETVASRWPAWRVVAAVAPSPGVEMTRKVWLDAAQILAPNVRRSAASAALAVLASDPLSEVVRLHPGLFTTRAAEELAS